MARNGKFWGRDGMENFGAGREWKILGQGVNGKFWGRALVRARGHGRGRAGTDAGADASGRARATRNAFLCQPRARRYVDEKKLMKIF